MAREVPKTAATAGGILNNVAAETGHPPVTDPYASPDNWFVQAKYLLNIAGDELTALFDWENLQTEATFNTIIDQDEPGTALPEDYARMIGTTMWDRTNARPVYGSLSPQDWQRLQGRNLATSTILLSFRIVQGQIKLFPDPPPDNLEIAYEYISNAWAYDQTTETFKSRADVTSDIVTFPRLLITRCVKLKLLESQGRDTTKAQDDFNQAFAMYSGSDIPAPVLNAGRGTWGPSYLGYGNIPDMGYGSV